MNARIIGCGKVTLVLAHGFGGTQDVWNKMIPLLTQQYRLVVFDWNFSSSVDQSETTTGFDAAKYSSLAAFADDLIVMLDEMKLVDVVFVGHSMSGMIGCIASVKRPDMFAHLVLIGGSPRYLNSDDGYTGGFDRAEVDTIISNVESNFETWAENLVTMAMGPNGDPTSTEKFIKGFQSMSPEIALCIAKAIFLGDNRAVLEKVEVACTIIQGTNDIVVPVSVAYYMQSKMKKAEAAVEILSSEGHFPQLTAPGRVADVLNRALLPESRCEPFNVCAGIWPLLLSLCRK